MKGLITSKLCLQSLNSQMKLVTQNYVCNHLRHEFSNGTSLFYPKKKQNIQENKIIITLLTRDGVKKLMQIGKNKIIAPKKSNLRKHKYNIL